MKTDKNKLCLRAILVVLFTLILPAPSHALSVSTDAIAITPTTAIFTLEFDFLTKDRPYYIPVGAMYNLDFDSELNYVGYEFVDRNGNVIENDSPTADFQSNAVVLSDLPIENGFYVLEPESQGSFTLVALLTVPSDSTPNIYSMRFKSLPHLIGEEAARTDITPQRSELFSTLPVFLNGPVVRIMMPDFVPNI